MDNAPPIGAAFEARYDGADGYPDDGGAEAPNAYRNEAADADAPGDEQQPPPQPDREMPAAVIKILVTNNVAGGLIGKKGQMINDMQAQSGARIKLSQTNDFFPGTQERTVLISGEQAEVMHAQELVLQRIQADPWIQPDTPVPRHLLPHPPSPPLPELGHLHHPGVSLDGHLVDYGSAAALGYAPPTPLLPPPPPATPLVTDVMLVRIVIPAPAAGAVIGRQGAHINQLKDETGAHIRLVRKEDSAVPNERLVKIQGTLAACCQVVNVVIARMGDEPELCYYHNMTTSYSRMLAGLSQHAHNHNGAARSNHHHHANDDGNGGRRHRGGRYRQQQQQMQQRQYHDDGSSGGYLQQQQHPHHPGAAAGDSGSMMPHMKANHYQTHLPHHHHHHHQHHHLPLPPPSLHYPPPYSHGGAPSPLAMPHVMPHAMPYGTHQGRFAAHPSQSHHLHLPAAAAGMWPPYLNHLPLMHHHQLPSVPSLGATGVGAADDGGTDDGGTGEFETGEEFESANGQSRSAVHDSSYDGEDSGESAAAAPEDEGTLQGSNGGLNYQQQVGMVQLAVADWLVPCLLGTKGAALRELMAYSGATIKVSQRDEVIPGTMNRIVTCTGSPQVTQAAQYLIQQRLQMAQQQQHAQQQRQHQQRGPEPPQPQQQQQHGYGQPQQLPVPPPSMPPPPAGGYDASSNGNSARKSSSSSRNGN